MGTRNSAKERAKALYNTGSGHYSAGRYVQAISAFKQAYDIKPVPVLLRTLAKVYEKLDDLPMAIDYYQRYLGTQPKDAAKVRPKVARLSATMATWPSLNLKSTRPRGDHSDRLSQWPNLRSNAYNTTSGAQTTDHHSRESWVQAD